MKETTYFAVSCPCCPNPIQLSDENGNGKMVELFMKKEDALKESIRFTDDDGNYPPVRAYKVIPID